jgi:hypothetical protein
MFTVKATFDGRNFRFERPLPIKEDYEAVITFTNPVKKTQEGILQYFNTWDEDDVECIAEIIKERENFSLNRAEI